MTAQIFVADSSPLIAFQRIGQINLIRELLGKLYIPPAVRREVFGSELLPEWIEEGALYQPLAPRIMAVRLGAGEREAIALALERGATRLIVDDLPARRLATSLGVEIVGTLGLILQAKERGFIPAIRPLLLSLRTEGFHISNRLFAGMLSAAGEAE